VRMHDAMRATLVGLALTIGSASLDAKDPGSTPVEASPASDPAVQALEVEARTAALRILEEDIEAKIAELATLREQHARSFLDLPEETGPDIQTLVAFYQAMKPQNAAVLLERLPRNLAASVLSAMKTREAGKILNVMSPDIAVRISKLMAGEES